MAKVICTLANASALINGVAFVKSGAAMISEEIDDATAKIFASIRGYKLVGEKAPPKKVAEPGDGAETLTGGAGGENASITGGAGGEPSIPGAAGGAT
jgi:hypothetical protein